MILSVNVNRLGTMSLRKLELLVDQYVEALPGAECEADASVVCEITGLSYAQAMRQLRAACSRLGYRIKGATIDKSERVVRRPAQAELRVLERENALKLALKCA